MEAKRTGAAKYVFAALVCITLLAFQAIPWVRHSEAAPGPLGLGGSGAPTVTAELVLGGQTFGYFEGCSGLGSRSEIAETDRPKSTGVTEVVKVADRLRWNDIVLTRDLVGGRTGIWDLRKGVEEGLPDRRDGKIILYDVTHTPVGEWEIVSAWASAVSADGPIEKVVLSHQGCRRVK